MYRFTVLVSLLVQLGSAGYLHAQGDYSTADPGIRTYADRLSLSFGADPYTIEVGSSLAMQAKLYNYSSRDTVIILDVELESSPHFSLDSLWLPIAVRPGDVYVVNVTYAPKSAGEHSALLTFVMKDKGPLTVRMSGAARAKADVEQESTPSQRGHPNPARNGDHVNILRCCDRVTRLTIHDSHGGIVATCVAFPGAEYVEVETGALAAGTYIARSDCNHHRELSRFVVVR